MASFPAPILRRVLPLTAVAVLVLALWCTSAYAGAQPAGAPGARIAAEADDLCEDPFDAEDPDCLLAEEPCEWDNSCEEDWSQTEDEVPVPEEEEEVEWIQWPAPPKGAYARIRAGRRTATIPKAAPPPVRMMIRAANSLVRKPYRLGGGHRRWRDRAYDCSGAVSFVLHAAGHLDWPLNSGGLARWGARGPGKWVRVYAHKKHVFMVIAGLRFDTSPMGASGGKGPRWRETVRSTRGFKVRHPRGL
jgi:hypothetical protein